MNRRDFILTTAASVAGFLVTAGTAWANKAETKIEVPESAVKGSEITIKMTVAHSSNSFLHYTEWVWVQVNGKEVARWNYSSGNLPEGATFTKEIPYKVEDALEIKAKANCNLHGSAGEASAKVAMKE